MKQKEVWMNVGISVITSVVVFFLLAQFFGAPLFSPATSIYKGNLESQQIVNANACNADGVCETNTLKSFGGAIYIGQPQNEIKIARSGENDLGILGASKVKVNSLVSTGGAIYLGEDPNQIKLSESSGGSLGIQGVNTISVTALAGNGTAYACLDSSGNFLRSESPC